MGTGKSSAAITYLNEHSDEKFIYITPYLEEAARIKKGCPNLHFVEPSDKRPEYNFRKSEHTAALIKEGCNITTTHQAFKRYSPETLLDIQNQGYTLIIDENVEVLETVEFHPDDLKLALDAGYIADNNGSFGIVNKDYKGRALQEIFTMLKTRELVRVTDKDDSTIFYWALPPELITSFKNVFVLTYLFEGQSIKYFFDIYNIPYEYIGVERTESGEYRFGECPGYTPEYVYHLSDRLKILDSPRLNAIGDDYYALSMNWFKKEDSSVDQVRNNIYNCYHNIWKDIPADRRLWGSYNGTYAILRGKGYSSSFLTFNAKATNAYRDKDCLVYLPNLFMNVTEKTFYQLHGIEVNEDVFALSIMVQWIWRSAIRDGNQVNLYIPSRRMRTLLTNWMKDIAKKGGATSSVQ